MLVIEYRTTIKIRPTAKAGFDKVDIPVWAPSSRMVISVKKPRMQFYSAKFNRNHLEQFS
jgi:hypothetical protein